MAPRFTGASVFFFLMIRRPPRSTLDRSSAASDVYKRQLDNVFEITEDTMPGELANVIAGRICNLLNLRGPNFTTDAACASGLAALNAAIDGLVDHQYDAVVTGGVDRNMACLLYTSDAADERSSVDLGGRRIIKKKKKTEHDSRRRTESTKIR